MGALFFEGTVNLKIAGCQFERNDGNGIMLSGFNRFAAIVENHFAWTGDTAIAAWGRTDEMSDNGIHGWDGTWGDFPWHTLVQSNIIRETGIWEKQSSCWFQAKTAQTTLKGNLCFNLGRAGFNFNGTPTSTRCACTACVLHRSFTAQTCWHSCTYPFIPPLP